MLTQMADQPQDATIRADGAAPDAHAAAAPPPDENTPTAQSIARNDGPAAAATATVVSGAIAASPDDGVTAAQAGAGGPKLFGGVEGPNPPEAAEKFAAPDLSAEAATPSMTTIELLDDVELDVNVELGRTEMYIEDVLRLGAGSVVELDKLAGDPVDVFVNGRLVARGEVLVLNDNFCVRISEIESPIPELDGVK
jgi:flagellar motor switch protein FliN/FliY